MNHLEESTMKTKCTITRHDLTKKQFKNAKVAHIKSESFDRSTITNTMINLIVNELSRNEGEQQKYGNK